MTDLDHDPKGPPNVVRLRRRVSRRIPEAVAKETHQLFVPDSDWRAPDPRLLPDLSRLSGTIVGFDLETKDPALKSRGPGWPWRNGEVVGVSLDWGEQPVYLPLTHRGGDNLDSEGRRFVEQWLQALFADPGIALAMHNARYDLGWSQVWLGRLPAGSVHDTLTLAALLNEYRPSYRLDRISQEELREQKDESMLLEAARAQSLDPKGELWRMAARHVGAYAAQDARLTRQLALKFLPRISRLDLQSVVDLENRVSRVLLTMRRQGIRVDVDRARDDYARLRTEMHEITRSQFPRGVDVWSPTLGEWLTRNGYVLPVTELGRPSVTKDWLKAGARTDPRLAAILRVRQLDKLTETFIKSYLLDKEVNGRLYPEFHPLRSEEGGAVTGRFSSSHPNFQNLPAVRDAGDALDAGRLIRGYILPEPGENWVSFDYSQQEPRLAVHFATLKSLRGAEELRARYAADPRTDFYQIVSQEAGLERKQAKVISLGRLYGMGDAKMCRSLGLPMEGPRAGEEGQRVIDAFDRAHPWMRQLAMAAGQVAERRGYLVTLLGRRCRFRDDETGMPFMEGSNPVSLHKFLNRLIQGSAADQTKAAMVAVAEAGLGDRLRVTVHDELGLSLPDPASVAVVRQAMLDCVSLRVPSAVDVEMGRTWGSTTEWE